MPSSIESKEKCKKCVENCGDDGIKLATRVWDKFAAEKKKQNGLRLEWDGMASDGQSYFIVSGGSINPPDFEATSGRWVVQHQPRRTKYTDVHLKIYSLY